MKIALEVTTAATSQPTGCAYYTRRLATGLHEIHPEIPIGLYYKFSRIKKQDRLWRPQGFPVHYYMGRFRSGGGKPDIVHGTDVNTPNWNCAKVTTIHDAAIFLQHHEGFSPDAFVEKKRKQYQEVLQYSDAIIAVSKNTARDAEKLFGVDPKKIHVIYEGVDERFKPLEEHSNWTDALATHQLQPKKYLLYVGSISGRKNLVRMIEAYAESDASEEYPFILAGSLAYGHEAVLQTIERLHLTDKVRLIGYVSNQEIPLLIAGAAAFMFATYYEGFGLPILEAMASRTPVVIGTAGAAPEIAGGFCKEANPLEVGQIATALTNALQMAADELEAAQNHAGSFTWQKCASETLEVYSLAVGNRKINSNS
jgi:glycosyltransferase involved in cell wall biosynthesis